jgi:peptide/nickel transport system ATP-binding protein
MSFGLPLVGAVTFVMAIILSLFALGRISPEEQELRRRLQIIFQDPYSSLNPRQTVEQILLEPMTVHGIGENRSERRQRAGDLLEEVGLAREYLRRYPHEFSGGQRQRICIARTLALNPSIIICDESVSALDVSVQAQVLNLLKDLQAKYDLTYIFISHDLSVVKFMSDIMAVMKDGKIVEMGPSDAIYKNPKEVYTQNLISAIPKDDLAHIEALKEGRRQARIARKERALSA